MLLIDNIDEYLYCRINERIGEEKLMDKYEEYSKVMKAIADSNRLKIMDILSCGELCACALLENFEFTQPTLSHHMKILMESGLVSSRKEGNWTYYGLNLERVNQMMYFLMGIVTSTSDCICEECKQNE